MLAGPGAAPDGGGDQRIDAELGGQEFEHAVGLRVRLGFGGEDFGGQGEGGFAQARAERGADQLGAMGQTIRFLEEVDRGLGRFGQVGEAEALEGGQALDLGGHDADFTVGDAAIGGGDQDHGAGQGFRRGEAVSSAHRARVNEGRRRGKPRPCLPDPMGHATVGRVLPPLPFAGTKPMPPLRDPETLARSLRPRHVTMISIGGIIGAGIFVGSGAAIAVAGPAVLLSYALCGLLIFVIMRMLGEMAVARPGVGSFAGYAALGLGDWAGFVSGWLYVYFWATTIAIEAIAGAKILGTVVAVPVWLAATGLIGLMMLVNLLSVRAYGEFEFWFAALKLATIIGFIGVGAAWIFWAGPRLAWAHVVAHGGVFPLGWGAVFTAIPVVIFSMMGSEVATIAAAETEDPAGNVVRAGRTVSLRIMVFYIGAVGVIVAILPWRRVTPGLSPFTQALSAIHVPAAGLVMTWVVFTAILSCLNSAIYVTSRMLFEMAGRGDAPAGLAQVTARRVPRVALLAGCGFGLVVAMGSVFSPNGIFVFLLQSSGSIILLVYLLIALGEIGLRRRLTRAGAVLKLRVWAFPYVSLAAVGGILGVLGLMAATPGLRVQVALGLAGFGVALAGYGVRRRRVSAG